LFLKVKKSFLKDDKIPLDSTLKSQYTGNHIGGIMIIIDRNAEILGEWYESHLIVSRMTVDNYTNWRLPTIEELISISQQDNDFTLSNYWASDEDDEYAIQYSFADGTTSRRMKTRVAFVRAVRDA
jgi:hypothetical protein